MRMKRTKLSLYWLITTTCICIYHAEAHLRPWSVWWPPFMSKRCRYIHCKWGKHPHGILCRRKVSTSKCPHVNLGYSFHILIRRLGHASLQVQAVQGRERQLQHERNVLEYSLALSEQDKLLLEVSTVCTAEKCMYCGDAAHP